ncbi:MAG: alpha/beta fold hydrolase [Dehalococcoidia bacterium]|nr:alpha/beta fold hydrolase [Dehalococcoidia bacterium]
MAFLDRDGVRIYYDVQGSGPAVLLSHGYSATSQMWARQVEALKDNYRVITWDMRGHGQSDSPDDQSLYSEEATCGDMAGILKELGIDKAVVGGLSLGGYMSLAFNVRYPEMVIALMLFDTGPGYKNPVGREAWNKTAEARAVAFETKGLESLGRGAEVRIAQHRSAAGLAMAARGMLAQFDSRIIESLEHITVPTLVLVGAKDEPFLGATDYMAKKIAGSHRAVIPNAGHAANLDQPEIFNAATKAFLADLELI